MVNGWASSNIVIGWLINPGVSPVIRPEATYLVWLDCRELGLDDRELKDFMIKKAKVGLDDGPIFGEGGKGFQRLNIACPRKILEQGLRRIESAMNQIVNGEQ